MRIQGPTHKAGFQKNTWQQHNFKSVCVETSFMYRALDAHLQNLLKCILAKYKKRNENYNYIIKST
jgi:hypothetical protein